MQKRKLTTYLLVAVLVVVGVYWAYRLSMKEGTEEPIGVVVTRGQDNSLSGDSPSSQADQFIQILRNIDDVTLNDRALLQNNLFKNKLQDFGKIIEDRPIGRLNPFAPIGVGGMFYSSSTPRATTTATSSDTLLDSLGE